MSVITNVINFGKKNSSTILMIGGIILNGVGMYEVAKATKKALPIIDEGKEKIAECKEIAKIEPEYTEEICKADITKAKIQTGVKVAKTYLPAAVIVGTSLACIIGSHKILSARCAAIGAAYTALDTCFKDYRQNVIDKYGEEVDKELKYNLKVKKAKDGTVTYEATEKTYKKYNDASAYARFFDESNPYWDDSSEYNLMFLKKVEQEANDKLQANKILFLNDVYEALGFPKTKAGQVMGWTCTDTPSESDNYVDFGIYDINNPAKRDFVNGAEKCILLDFNVVNVWETM